MPQVSLYIDKETLGKIEELARKDNTSLSKWVGNNLKKLIKDEYPADYFGLFGSIKDVSFRRPDELTVDSDAQRMEI